MNKKLTIAALALITLASCTDNEFIGDTNLATDAAETQPILFGFNVQNTTRADIVGSAAADLLGSGFYVVGTKGTEGTYNPSPTLVFDNYLVYNKANTAGTTESNTANWEYVGVTPGETSTYANWVKLSSLNSQTIKYWDYSEAQYDFHAFSTGTFKAVSKTDLSGSTSTTDDDVVAGEIGVTPMKYGTALSVEPSTPTAYTFYIPSIDALKNVYITDITTVPKTNYNNEVQLTFKNLGSKIRLALYETVPGYSIQASSVKFYTVDNDVIKLGETDYSAPIADAVLISADNTYGFIEKGTVDVSFPKVGSSNNSNANYKKASVSVNPLAVTNPDLSQEFGALNSETYANKEGDEENTKSYLGRTLATATYAGVQAVDYYQLVFPVSNSSALTLRVDYTLISTDGSGETINVYGAKAVVPATYTVWQPNYAYTYVFKISDNSNGWTSQTVTDPKGLFPITFDAVVAEIKEVSGKQTTITTVATPTITTYQQYHDKLKDEYSKSVKNHKNESVTKNIYVQVMDNNTPTKAALVGFGESGLYKLNTTTTDDTPTDRSLLYVVTNATGTATPISEASVMDALQNRSSNLTSTNITGRNGIVLTKNTNIDATVTSIENGVDDKAITITAGQAAKINMSSSTLTAGTYAFVYDYSDAAKTTKTFYQPTVVTSGIIANNKKYIKTSVLANINDVTTGSEEADDAYVYFSKTTTDGTSYTYSYYSVDGKTGNLPAGLLKVNKTTGLSTGDGTVTAVADTFVFDVYTRNTGKYAVKIIKIEN